MKSRSYVLRVWKSERQPCWKFQNKKKDDLDAVELKFERLCNVGGERAQVLAL